MGSSEERVWVKMDKLDYGVFGSSSFFYYD